MRKLTMLLFAATLPLAPVTALAAGSHSGGHHDEMMLGKPAEPAQAGRTIAVRMLETDDGAMLFEPSSIAVKRGETVLLEIRNDGEIEHEFVMDGHEMIQEHKVLMEKFPEMEHADPNAVRLEPGESGQIAWTFTNDGSFEFACLIPGHYESGMHGPLTVAAE
ncbi:cupredoxin domain-containing protein [Aurantimonas coralicida]|uniref:cupredoxin domain-containing protein n=1 Tax=Aurantimonas coralicida TaxID=182270 RepID=UPI00042A28C1|nr:plastocyanin/azurin family copper-binding protein [Aurantimonas coralicida]MCW7546212.1 plastocyanin/azurin family copper-binding protein [Aurantimonas litoralis]